MERLSKEERVGILAAFTSRYETDDDPNIDVVSMRYNVWEGDYIEVRAKDIFAAHQFPHIFNGCAVFLEEAPKVYFPVG